jgi:hypothetical protein
MYIRVQAPPADQAPQAVQAAQAAWAQPAVQATQADHIALHERPTEPYYRYMYL